MNIEQEMLSMVDFDSFFEAVKVTAERSDDIKKEYVEDYLKMWAKAKAPIFELFGHKLQIVREVDLKVDESVMRDQLKSLCKQYPEYAASIMSFTVDEWLDNEIKTVKDGCFFGAVFPKIYKKSAKPTKILSKLNQDPQFDIDVSKIMQNRTVKGKIALSIHPLDFVTMSTNTHKWGSCIHILTGFNKVGGYALMLDDVSIIAYSDNGVDTTYENKWGSFKWNNKTFRQCIYLVKDGFAFGHYNGTVSDEIRTMWDEMMCSLIGGDWGKLEHCDTSSEKAGPFYYDTMLTHKHLHKGAHFCKPTIGVKTLKCIRCGREITTLVGYHDWLTCRKD